MYYIYHKQCDIKKKLNETAQTANFTVSTIYRRELPVERAPDGAKLGK